MKVKMQIFQSGSGVKFKTNITLIDTDNVLPEEIKGEAYGFSKQESKINTYRVIMNKLLDLNLIDYEYSMTKKRDAVML